MKKLLPFLLTFSVISAEVVEKDVAYKDGDTELEGFFAHDPDAKQTGKAVLIIPPCGSGDFH